MGILGWTVRVVNREAPGSHAGGRRSRASCRSLTFRLRLSDQSGRLDSKKGGRARPRAGNMVSNGPRAISAEVQARYSEIANLRRLDGLPPVTL
jgi:hypothetical protein